MNNLRNIRKIKARDGSYCHNNFVKVRSGDSTIIEAMEETVRIRFNGYAIIPIEE